MTGIYKITNTKTNKIYIGQSTNIPQRWHAHLHEIKHGRGLAKYIQDATVQDFSFEIVELCAPEELDERERYWIAYYDSYEDGMNRAKGGKDGKFKLREDTLRYLHFQEKKEKRKQAILDTLEKWVDVPIDASRKEILITKLIEAGLRTQKNKKDFKFPFIIKHINEIGQNKYELVPSRVNKKALQKYPDLKYRQQCYFIRRKEKEEPCEN